MRSCPALIAFLARDLENSCRTGDIRRSILSSLLSIMDSWYKLSNVCVVLKSNATRYIQS